MSGEEIAARASRNPYASRRDSYVTGSLAGKREGAQRRRSGERITEEDEFEDN
jgi:hypothetical protein